METRRPLESGPDTCVILDVAVVRSLTPDCSPPPMSLGRGLKSPLRLGEVQTPGTDVVKVGSPRIEAVDDPHSLVVKSLGGRLRGT